MKLITILRLRLGLDAICWVSATIALLWFQYPTIAALVGAFGIVYLYRMVQRYRQYVSVIRMKEEMEAALIQFLNTGEQPDGMNIEYHQFEDEQEFIDWLNQNQDDDHPNP